ncbi:MAG: multi-sensor hybrid histidine kinase [Chloroflexi bacterium]|nr:MAG: multi-sensor hybrid histidine kinase [Chloroflexota bacterium]
MPSDLKILLAEDNEINQHLMLRILSRIGYSAALANNGIQVLNKMDQEDFDVILMDIQMPEMDGVTATKLIRAHYPATKQPKIIALTAESSKGEKDKYLDAGMDAVLTKPIQLDNLISVLELISEQTELILQASSANLREEKNEDLKTLNENVLRDFMELMGDEGKGAGTHLIELYKKDAPKLIDQMEIAINQKNTEGILRLVHTLKGSSSQIGAIKLEQLCQRLEILIKQSVIDNLDIQIASIKHEFIQLSDALDQFQANIA